MSAWQPVSTNDPLFSSTRELTSFSRTGQAVASGVPWVTLGLLLGISFIAQPAKFSAPGVELPQLVSVGSTIFHASHWTQWVLLVLCATFSASTKERKVLAFCSSGLALALLAAQHLLLMPMLDARVQLYLAGGRPDPSNDHLLYVAVEAMKVVAVLVLCALKPKTKSNQKMKKTRSAN